MGGPAEVYIFLDDYVVDVKTTFQKFQDNLIYISTTPLLERFGRQGQKVYLKYKSFILPTRVVGRNENYILLEFPKISPEKPIGDRKSIRVPPLKEEKFKVTVGNQTKDLYDISEEGFAVYCNLDDIDNFKNKNALPFYFELPRVKEIIKGTANLVNIRDCGDKIICGFEMVDIPNVDSIKIRFYIYERIKEILEGKE